MAGDLRGTAITMKTCIAGLLLAALPILAQTAVIPAGTGTAADPYRIAELGHLVWMGASTDSSAGSYYALQNDIDAAGTATWNDADTDESVIEGFLPIGTAAVPFAGEFDGQGHVIRGLTVARAGTDGVGLFGWTRGGSALRRLGLEGGCVTGRSYVGGLVGHNDNASTIEQCHAAGTVMGWGDYVGGLVGWSAGPLTQCHATGVVTGALAREYYVGGLVGANYGIVKRCHATGAVAGEYYVGGLLGHNSGGTVEQCYATGPATGEDGVGGLLGYNTGGTVEECYATGPATGDGGVGGLLGYNTGGTVEQCYATGAVVGGSSTGGVAGWNGGTVGQCYWDTERSGWATSAGGTGCTTAQMQQQSTYVGWDFTNAWGIVAGQSCPYLQWSPSPFTLTVIASGPGSISVDPAQASYPAGAVVTLHAVASVVRAEFVRWLGPVASPTAAGTPVRVAGHLTVVGLFRVARGISSVQDLQRIGRDPEYPPNGRYWLTQDIEAAETAGWNDADTDGSVLEGFRPLGTAASPFTGDFDGQGYVIRDLTVNRAGTDDVGLFGRIGSGGVVRHLGLEGGSVTGNYRVGSLVGRNYFGTVTRCHAAVAVTGYRQVGGLLGGNLYGTVGQSHATGAVVGDEYTGGLVGRNDYGTVEQCYATGVVNGADNVGGLVGMSHYGTVEQCHATGVVTGDDGVGGLVGYSGYGTVKCSYATGAVTGADYLGGLVGEISMGTIEQCYATGAVNGRNRVGGLLGSNRGTVTQCYWDMETSGLAASAGGDGRTTAAMQQQSTYEGWDFAGLWGLAAGPNHGYPYLRQVGPWAVRLLAGIDRAELDWGRRLWDVTGTYPTTLAGDPLTLNLVHEGAGRITGTAVLSLAAGGKAAIPTDLWVRGGLTGADGTLLLRLTLVGADSARTVRVALALTLALDVDARQLAGTATGSLRTAAGTLALADTLTLDLPADMDGTWTLLVDLAVLGRASSGSALLTLANGVEHLFTASGRSAAAEALVLRLGAAATDPAARGIRIRAKVTPLGGGRATLDSLQALLYGQALNW